MVAGSLARAGVEKSEITAPLDSTIRSQSIIGTRFALENMMFEEEGDFDMPTRHPRLTKHTTAPPDYAPGGGASNGGMLDKIEELTTEHGLKRQTVYTKEKRPGYEMEETKRADNKQNQRMIMRMSKQIKYEDVKFLQSTGAADLSASEIGPNKLAQSQQIPGTPNKNAVLSRDDFLLGAEAAREYEEYLVLKTNRHSVRQQRVLVIDGEEIYHKKPKIDAHTGELRAVQNNVPQDLSQSAMAAGSPTKKRKTGFLAAKVNNFLAKPVFQGNKKSRFIGDIIQIEQMMDKGTDEIGQITQPKQANKFFILFREARGPNGHIIEDANADRKVIYETETPDDATYVVAKVRTLMRLHANKLFANRY